jgi:sulfite reductase (NADPH) flavoprotein alpha-component
MDSASELIERVALTNSSSVFVYDLAEHVGFGHVTKKLSSDSPDAANVFTLQTRAGAGLSLVGRLSEEGTSKDAQKDSILTAYTTPRGLCVMAASFAALPKPTASSRVIVHVPAVTPIGPSLELSPSLAPLNAVLGTLPETFVVLLSSTPQESVDIAAVAYKITNAHVIHIFDHHSTAREMGHRLIIPSVPPASSAVSVREALKDLSYSSFEYYGDAGAENVVVALNGALGSTVRAVAENSSDLGVLIVRVLRPWDDETFLTVLPASTKNIHVLDEVSTEGAQGTLYTDVFSSCFGTKAGKPSVHPHRIIPARTQEFVKSPSVLINFLQGMVPGLTTNVLGGKTSKKLIFFGTPNSALASLPVDVVQTFTKNKSINVRSLAHHDAFSKPGGIFATRVILYPVQENKAFNPIGVEFEATNGSSGLKADFVAILDQNLLKTHDLFSSLAHNGSVLVFTTWTAPELVSILPSDALLALRATNANVYMVNTQSLEIEGKSLDIVGQLVFLRLYLGQAATENLLKDVAHQLHARSGLPIDKLNAKAWASLERITLPAVDEQQEDGAGLESFEFNAISPDVELTSSLLPGSHLSTWHDAAYHILFPDAFTPAINPSDEEYPPIPSLRPEAPERTFLITCSVNRRLTPLDYDRNVFHLEFDAAGTGLKYEIGEALGVHGWNDTDDVLRFCEWYGVDPDRLLTLPVPGIDGQVHTRTIFQALQQQVDLFGKPPKNFYAELANHATSKNDKLTLQFIGSPEGSSMFKKLSEKDTVTFADVLLQYKSARPGIEMLCELIGDIKPRHYSIASAQSVVGNRVDLLVVTVEWQTPSGKKSFLYHDSRLS